LKFIKWLAGLILTLALLLLVAIIVIPMMVDPNDYRDELTTLVKDKTGRDLALDGDLQISVFPWLGIDVQALSLSQPEQIGGDMLSVQNAQLRVKFMPLLSKKVEVDTVVLKDPKVRLVTLKDGTDSFSGLTGDSEEDSSADQQAGAAVALVIQGVELSNGSVIIDDQQAGSRTEIKDLNLLTGNLIGDSLADLSLSGSLIDSASADEMLFKLTAEALIDTDTLQVQIADLLATVSQGDLGADLKAQSINVNQAQEIVVKELGVTVTSPQQIQLSAPEISAKMESQEARIGLLQVVAGDFKANLSDLVATQFIDAPKASGKLSVPGFNAASLLKDFDIDFEPTDKTALRNVSLETSFSGGLDSASLKDLIVKLDESTLTGSASVKDYAEPSVNFDFALDSLNLDRYLPVSEEGEESESVSGGEALAVPMVVFKELNANGRFQAKSLISGGLELNDIDVEVASTPGSVTITPKASLYKGKLDGQIAYSETNDTAKLRIKNDIDLVELGEMLTAADITDQLSGIGSLALDILVTEKNGVQSNEGTIKLFAKDGAIDGVDIKGIVENAYSQYQSFKGREPEEENEEAKSEESDQTRFAELLGTFNLKDFKITNNDFAMKAPLFRVGGQGEIDIENQLLNYLVDFSVVNSTDGQGGEALEKLKGITIPIRLKGDLTAPSYSLDMKALYKSLVKQRVEDEKDKYLKEKLGLEGDEKLSTKDALKQYLLNKSNKGDKKPQGRERPIGEREANKSLAPEGSEVEDVPGQPEQAVEPEKSDKDKLKDDLKKKLLDSLFD